MDPEIKIYLITGTIITAILTLILHYPFDIDWILAFALAVLATFFGVFIVVQLD